MEKVTFQDAQKFRKLNDHSLLPRIGTQLPGVAPGRSAVNRSTVPRPWTRREELRLPEKRRLAITLV